MEKVKVYSPGSIGNVGCGFDVFGLAIDAVGDTVEVTKNNSGELTISEIIGDDSITKNAQKNIISVGAAALIDVLDIKEGFDFKITKGVAAGSGMGSSGSSATAGVFAVNELVGRPFTRNELLQYAVKGEQVASPQIHYDNIAPSMLGGLCVIRSEHPLDILEIPTPQNLYLAMVRPGVVINTNDAKQLLGETIPLKIAVKQFGNVAGLMVGMLTNDIALAGRSVEDLIATPLRSTLIPKFNEARESALYVGAAGFNISGSGPAMFAICDGLEVANKVLETLKRVYKDDPKAEFFITKPDTKGTRVIS